MRRITLTDKEQKELQLEILIEVDTFCKKNNIRYSLAFGTLIGAIRHKGFIPWDDDIDIIMPLPDMLRFKEEFFSNELKYCDIDTEPFYANPFSNISLNSTYRKEGLISRKYYGLGLDVYPMVGFPSDKDEGSAFFGELEKLQVRRIEIIKWRRRIIRYLPIRNILGYNAIIREYAKKMLYSYPYNEAKAFFIAGGLTWKCVFNYDMFKSLIEVIFEGHTFYAVSEYDRYLSQMYGDYMQLPPVDERVPHHGQNYYWK